MSESESEEQKLTSQEIEDIEEKRMEDLFNAVSEFGEIFEQYCADYDLPIGEFLTYNDIYQFLKEILEE